MRLPNSALFVCLSAIITGSAQSQTDLVNQLPFKAPIHQEVISLTDKPGDATWKTTFDQTPRWFQIPGSTQNGMQIFDGSGLEVGIPMPDASVASGKQMIAYLDVVGTSAADGNSVVTLSFHTPEGELVGKTQSTMKLKQVGTYPMRLASIKAVPKGNGNLAIDGNARTFWGTGYKGHKDPAPPFNLDLDLGQDRAFSGFKIIPGMPHYTEGMPVDWAFYTSSDGETWNLLQEGKIDYTDEDKRDGAKRREQSIRFSAEQRARYVRFQTRSLLRENQVNIAEFDLIWNPAELPKPAPKSQRITLALPHQSLMSLAGKTLTVRAESKGSGDLIISDFHLEQLPLRPNRKDEAKPNGVDGPDRIGIGLLGFDALTSHNLAYLPLMKVYPGTPAEKAGLQPGDVITSINGTDLPAASCASGWDWFYYGPEALLGRACQVALQSKDSQIISLGIIRSAEPLKVNLDLSTWNLKGAPNARFPLAGPLSDEFEADLIKWIRDNQEKGGNWKGEIQTSFAVLGLLGTRDPQHAEAISKAIDYTLAKHPPIKGGLSFWGLSFTGIMMCEYHLASGDPRVLPWIERCVTWMPTVSNTSKWKMPTFGHGPGGLPYGQKALMAPLSHMLVFEALAERCGIDVKNQAGEPEGIWEIALPYSKHCWSDPAQGGHGAMGYNASYKDLGEFWSRSGLFSLAAVLRGEVPEMSSAMAKIMRERHAWMRGSHAYGAPGNVLGLLGLAMADRDAFEEVMQAWSWSFLGAWHPGEEVRWSMPHMGAPYMGEDVLIHPMYLALMSTRRNSLHITGATDKGWLDVPADVKARQLTIQRQVDGNVAILSNGKPDEIRYTIDGSGPNENASSYEGPIALPNGGLVRAVAIHQGKRGEVTQALIEAQPIRARVIEATGSEDQTLALRHASALVDGDPSTSWQTDLGQLATGWPHSAKIDLGTLAVIDHLILVTTKSDASPAKIGIRFSQDGEEWTSGKGFSLKNANDAQVLQLDRPLRARFIEIKAIEPNNEKSKNLTLNELTVIPPRPVLTRTNDGKAKLSLPSGTTARLTTDGSQPNPNSPLYFQPFEITSGQIIGVDLYRSKQRISRTWFEIK